MQGLISKLRPWFVSEDGATAIHIAVMFALIAIVWLVAVASISNGNAGIY